MMQKPWTGALFALVGLAFFLVACAASTPSLPTEMVVSPSAPLVAEPTLAATEATLPSPVVPTQTSTPVPSPVAESEQAVVSYSRQVQPILDRYCISCHGVNRVAEGLDLTSYEKVMAGSRNGPIVIPGQADKSLLVLLVETGEMPKRGAKPTAEQIQILRDWVNAGAPKN